jgi:DHA1 family bicyclomycin/chloramphenicol resistance-like MFS transporter
VSQQQPNDGGGERATITVSSPEFVALIAALMSINALAIDIMLPALPNMGADLAVTDPNHRQYVVIAYVLGLGAAQLVFGPASDRYGRRRPLLISLIGYAVFGGACIFAPSFEMLVAARALQGVSAAGARVISLSVVRDVYAGRQMARTMSLVMMVFMAVPMLAPNLGQLVLFVAPWRWIFVVLVCFSLALTVWVARRLMETLPPQRRRALDIKSLGESYWLVFKTRTTCGYMLATGATFGALFAFISASEQIYRGVFDKQASFTLYFASVAGAMAVAAFLNARLVVRWGMRRLAHMALVSFTVVNLLHVVLSRLGVIGFAGFHGLMMLSFFAFAFIGANFNAIAMEPLGKIAGTASAALGFTSTLVAGTLGAIVGQQFDGTTTPIITGFMALGVVALAIVVFTERGRLFGDDELRHSRESGNPP